ncbi:amidohydrolase family protein [Lysobacter enzymogenes]|uniref:Amidohydrolase n=1 Tax=Lysobacter enzymogenes TaxID=69 RepID=A0A3N2RHY8_LYSEN|nr:amidohydrolase family protein [Lysobacter enzymogenes]ROU06999.1 amidohydrolase [Lysobacter enzymogenes]
MDAILRGAGWLSPEGLRRTPLAIRAGRVDDAAPARAYALDLQGHVLLPGLINAHEHLHLNAVPPLRQERAFANAYQWIEAFQAHFADPAVAAALAVPKALRLRHGGLKNLLAGATCAAHHDPWHPALDAADFPIALLRGHGWAYAPGWPQYGPPLRESFLATPPQRPWLIHLSEGTDAVARAELGQLDALGCLAANTVLIHGVGLGEDDQSRVIARGAAVVWCPSSNLALLGRTLDPRRLHAAGRLALGSDSRLSGARDLLDELRLAASIGGLSASDVFDLASARAADVLRLDRGRLRPGAAADLIVVADRGGAPADSLVGLRRADLRAVARGGVPRIADPDFAPWFRAAGVDTAQVELDGRPKLLAKTLADPQLLALEPGLSLCEPVAPARAAAGAQA